LHVSPFSSFPNPAGPGEGARPSLRC
jgi:hypothetical protein